MTSPSDTTKYANLSLVPTAHEPRASKFDRLFQESIAIEAEDAKKFGHVGYINRVMVQATLPYREPLHLKDRNVFGRRAGEWTLVIQQGVALEEAVRVDGKGRKHVELIEKPIGFPYGSKPRLLLAWMGREIKLKKSREIVLGESLTKFMDQLGFEGATGGRNGSMTLMKQQMMRLFSARIALVRGVDPESSKFESSFMQIADRTEFWWNRGNPDQLSLYQNRVEISEKFYNELHDHTVPVDLRVLRALKQSPLDLDLYMFLTYRYFILSKRTVIPWEALQMQFGTEIHNPRHFKAKVIKALSSISVVYPAARYETNSSGLVLFPSRTSISAG